MKIHYGPVTELEVDAIVNAANTQLGMGEGWRRRSSGRGDA